MHSGGRRKGKGRSRILYWFRTPPGVRVGRAALDEDAIRLIEEHNPEIEFDWTRILKGHGAEPMPDREQDERPDKRRRDERRPAGRLETRVAAAPPTPGGRVPAAGPPVGVGDVSAELEDHEDLEDVEPLPLGEGAPVEAPAEPTAAQTTSPAHARLGFEGVSRLRARYAELLARISERVSDPARQEELRGQAERLNPDTWVTDAEVASGLESYEAAFEVLRAAVGGTPRRRSRRRRSGGGRIEANEGGGHESARPEDASSDGDEPSQDQ